MLTLFLVSTFNCSMPRTNTHFGEHTAQDKPIRIQSQDVRTNFGANLLLSYSMKRINQMVCH
jgi:hypothetical protein